MSRRRWLFAVVVVIAAALVGVFSQRRPAAIHESVRASLLKIRVRESETELPLVARVVVRPLDADATERTRTVSLRRGEGSLMLPTGRYRISATHGVEWTMDAAQIDLTGEPRALDLHLRHVIPPTNLVGCDVHVETTARDDDRVLAAAATGLDLIVTRGGSTVVDDRAALSRADLVGKLAVAGGIDAGIDLMEVYRGSDVGKIARADTQLRAWFDLLEAGAGPVACGVSGDGVLGFPRTYVDIGTWRQGYSGAPLDVETTLDALRKGRGFVTSGPILDFTMLGDAVIESGVNTGADTNLAAADFHEAQPGGTLRWSASLSARVTIRAPPWLDVSSFEVIAGNQQIHHQSLPARELAAGGDGGSNEEAIDRAVRFDGDIQLAIPPAARWVVLIARGDGADDDAIPGIRLRPLAFTQPIWLAH